MGFAVIAGLGVVWLVWQTERLARQRAQFAASAAHELRTPLTGLRIFSEMLAEGLGDPSKAREYARRIADESERLGRVVANVLGFTRIQRGTLSVRPSAGDFAQSIRENVARQQPALDAAGAQLSIQIPDALPHVKFDRDALGQIVQNLLDNSEKHTRAASDRTIHISLASRNGRVELSVVDHGKGLPPQLRRTCSTRSHGATNQTLPRASDWGSRWSKRLPRRKALPCITRTPTTAAPCSVSRFPPSRQPRFANRCGIRSGPSNGSAEEDLPGRFSKSSSSSPHVLTGSLAFDPPSARSHPPHSNSPVFCNNCYKK